jgi:hypothetical protein
MPLSAGCLCKARAGIGQPLLPYPDGLAFDDSVSLHSSILQQSNDDRSSWWTDCEGYLRHQSNVSANMDWLQLGGEASVYVRPQLYFRLGEFFYMPGIIIHLLQTMSK